MLNIDAATWAFLGIIATMVGNIIIKRFETSSGESLRTKQSDFTNQVLERVEQLEKLSELQTRELAELRSANIKLAQENINFMRENAEFMLRISKLESERTRMLTTIKDLLTKAAK